MDKPPGVSVSQGHFCGLIQEHGLICGHGLICRHQNCAIEKYRICWCIVHTLSSEFWSCESNLQCALYTEYEKLVQKCQSSRVQVRTIHGIHCIVRSECSGSSTFENIHVTCGAMQRFAASAWKTPWKELMLMSFETIQWFSLVFSFFLSDTAPRCTVSIAYSVGVWFWAFYHYKRYITMADTACNVCEWGVKRLRAPCTYALHSWLQLMSQNMSISSRWRHIWQLVQAELTKQHWTS